ncbi:MAG: VOC family protein [Acholeplasmataceae bacterium]|jgi:catechol 2,3-dioxygenase-like lactoylglutathione lyase family enzyme|nr:VOC family protein [Acholeplasmataceae bacterium]
MRGHINHIEIYVSDLKQSLLFWRWFLEELGYTSYQSWDKGHSWKLGHSYIVFVQTKKEYMDIGYHRCRVGLNHLAFYADSRRDVDDMTQKLIQRGVPILYLDRHPYAGGKDYYAVFFEDPDRIKVEFVAP